MEKKKRFKTILIALVMAVAMLGAGYGSPQPSRARYGGLSRIRHFRDGSGKLQ
jgi:hypothetical protein